MSKGKDSAPQSGPVGSDRRREMAERYPGVDRAAPDRPTADAEIAARNAARNRRGE